MNTKQVEDHQLSKECEAPFEKELTSKKA